MSVFDAIIYRKLCDLYRHNRYFVRTIVIADFLGKNERIIRRSLARMEQTGHVRRRGQRGGWAPATRIAH